MPLTQEQITEYRNKYGLGSNPVKKPVETVEKPSNLSKFIGDVQTSFQERGKKTAESLTAETKTGGIASPMEALQGGFNVAGQFAGGATDILASGISNLPGAESIGKVVSNFSNKVAELVNMNPNITNGLNAINSGIDAYKEWATNNPEDAKTIDATFNLGSLIPFGSGSKVVSKPLVNAVDTLSDVTKKTVPVVEKVVSTGENLLGKITPESSEIMNRVARLNPTDANKFKELSGGKTVGEYLTETGNFNRPDKIVVNEATKFANSVKSVDDALAQLPGTFQAGPIEDALTSLVSKAESVSGKNVPSPYLNRTKELLNKYNTTGLDMSEINEVKRLYEKNVKLGYDKRLNPDKVELATNIDNSLRTWQVNQAEQLGFKNIAELNKQTQLSRFIIDNLGDKLVSQGLLNGVSLTDWIMLSGIDVTGVGGYLTKKFFSDPGIQAKIAELLNKSDVKGIITPDIGPSKVLQLPAPAAGSPQSGIDIPINMPSRRAIDSGTEIVPKNATPLQQPQQGKVKLSSQNNNASKANNIAPTTNTSNRIIDTSVPQEKSFIQKIVDKYNDIPNKEGGFARFDFGLGKKMKSEGLQNRGKFVPPEGMFNTSKSEGFKDLGGAKAKFVEPYKSNSPSIITEAKKYKSADEFVKAQTDPLSEFKTGAGIKDEFIARGTVKEAISDIGGIKNVERGFIDKSKLEVTENINTSSQRYRQVLEEVKNGERTPIIVNEYGEVLDGHHRLKAYEEIGLKEIPVIAPKGTPEIKVSSKSQLTDLWNKANKK